MRSVLLNFKSCIKSVHQWHVNAKWREGRKNCIHQCILPSSLFSWNCASKVELSWVWDERGMSKWGNAQFRNHHPLPPPHPSQHISVQQPQKSCTTILKSVLIVFIISWHHVNLDNSGVGQWCRGEQPVALLLCRPTRRWFGSVPNRTSYWTGRYHHYDHNCDYSTLIVMCRVEKQVQIQLFENWSGLKRWLQQQVSSDRLELPSNWRWTLFHDNQETFLSNKTILGASYRPRWGRTLRYKDPHCESFYIIEQSPNPG